MNSMKTFV